MRQRGCAEPFPSEQAEDAPDEGLRLVQDQGEGFLPGRCSDLVCQAWKGLGAWDSMMSNSRAAGSGENQGVWGLAGRKLAPASNWWCF